MRFERLFGDRQIKLYSALDSNTHACLKLLSIVCRVGQDHIYMVYIRYFWQGNHQIYGHVWCIYTVLANPDLFVYDVSPAWLPP